MNVNLSIETNYIKISKDLKPTNIENWEICDSILREFVLMLVDAGWQPGSVKEAVIALADEYVDFNADII